MILVLKISKCPTASRFEIAKFYAFSHTKRTISDINLYFNITDQYNWNLYNTDSKAENARFMQPQEPHADYYLRK